MILIAKKRKHRELEKAVIRVMTAIRNFTNPFEVAEKRKLYTAELFFEPLPRLKQQIMASCNNTAKLTTSDGKILQYKGAN